MVSTSAVLDHHLKSFAEYDLDGVLAPDFGRFLKRGQARRMRGCAVRGICRRS
jgi:hypothetical protein